MLLTICAKGFEMTPFLKTFTEEVLEKVDPILPEDTMVQVTLSKEKKTIEAHGYLQLNGETISVREADEDGYDAIHNLSHQLFNTIKKTQAKTKDKARKQRITMEPQMLPDDERIIVKRKTFEMKPMFEEEALLQMMQLNHTFFFFFNADTQSMCLLYQRHDGDYGIIEGI